MTATTGSGSVVLATSPTITTPAITRSGNGDVFTFTNGVRTGYFHANATQIGLFTGAGSTGEGILIDDSTNVVYLWVGGGAIASATSTGFNVLSGWATTLTGTLSVTAGATFNNTVAVVGNLAVNTSKFTVAASSGNTAIAGTLAVTGTSAFTGSITASGGLVGNVTGNASGSAGSVAAANITGTTLAAGVTASSLTSLGTIAALSAGTGTFSGVVTVGLAAVRAAGTANNERNLFIGESAGNATLTGTENTSLGYKALNTVVGGAGAAGSFNTAVGSWSQASLTTGFKNASLGRATLDNLTAGYENTAVGYGASHWMTTGYQNTAVGMEAVHDVTTGFGNTGVGAYALRGTTGNYNTAVGNQAMQLTVAGSNNAALGVNALYSNVSGGDNVAIGYGALVSETGSRHTAVGFNAGAAQTPGFVNTTNIGAEATCIASNQVTLGGAGVTSLRVPGVGLTVDSAGLALDSTNTVGVLLGPSGFNASINYNTDGNLDITPRAGYTTRITAGGLTISGLPTSSVGLSAGQLWNDSGTVKIV